MTSVQRLTAKTKSAFDTIWHYRLLVASVFAILLVLSFVFVNSLQRQYVAGANLLVVNGTTRDDPTLSSPDLPSIATSTVVLSRMEHALGLTIPLTDVKRHLIVKPPAYRSSILRIEYTDPSRMQAMNVANGVAEELTKYYRQISTARYDEDLRSLDAEMNKERDRTRQLDRQVHASGMGAYATDKGADAIAAHYGDLELNSAMANATLQGDIAQLGALKSTADQQTAAVRYEMLHNDPTYQNLQTSAAASAVALADTRAAFTPNYPGLPAVQAKYSNLKAELDRQAQHVLSSPHAFSASLSAMQADEQKANALVQADRAKASAVNQLLAQERSKLRALPTVEGAQLERDAAQAAYLSIAARRATALANRADALSLGSVVIVDRAIASNSQIGLGKMRVLALLGILVVVLAIGSAFIADQFNPRLSGVSNIEDIYGRPVVATIGHK